MRVWVLVLPIPVLLLVSLVRLGKILIVLVIFVCVLAVGAIFIVIPLVPVTMLAVVVRLVLIAAFLSVLLGTVTRLLSVPALFARLPRVGILPTTGALLPVILPSLAKRRAE